MCIPQVRDPRICDPCTGKGQESSLAWLRGQEAATHPSWAERKAQAGKFWELLGVQLLFLGCHSDQEQPRVPEASQPPPWGCAHSFRSPWLMSTAQLPQTPRESLSSLPTARPREQSQRQLWEAAPRLYFYICCCQDQREAQRADTELLELQAPKNTAALILLQHPRSGEQTLGWKQEQGKCGKEGKRPHRG